MRTAPLALVPRAVALNLAIGAVVATLKLPVYLDSIGTILVAALAGPAAAIVTGVASNVVLGLLVTPVFFAFIPVTIVIGGVSGLAARIGAFRSLGGTVVAGVATGVLAGLTSVPIVLAIFEGVTAGGTGLVTIVLHWLGFPTAMAAGVASVGIDVLDKTVTCLLVRAILVRLPGRTRGRFVVPVGT